MGNFITVGEGNALHRLVIGFDTGASTVQTLLQVYQAPEAHKLLEFTPVRTGRRECDSFGCQDLQIGRCPHGRGKRRSSGTLFIGVFCQTGLDQTGPDAQGEEWFTDASDECE